MKKRRTSPLEVDQAGSLSEARDDLAVIQENRDDPYKSNSDGYILSRMVDDIEAKSATQKKALLKPANFGPWIQSKYGIRKTQGARVLSIITSDFWRKLWASYVRTPYGQKSFNFSTAEDISSTKLEVVSY